MDTLKRIEENGKLILHNQLVFGQHWLSLSKRIDNDNCDTAMTDGKEIVYNESFADSLGWRQLHTLSLHEVLHVAFADHLRIGKRDPQLWNCACDYVNNLLLLKMGCEPIDDWLCTPDYAGKSKEEVYGILKDKSKDEQDRIKQRSNSSGGSFQEPKKGNGESLSDEEKDEGQKEASQKLSSGLRAAQKVAESLQEQAKGDNPQKAQKARERLKEIGYDAFEALGIELGEIIETRIPWQETLHRFIQTALAKDDYSWQDSDEEIRAATGFYVPAIESEKLENICLVIDCSDSLSHIEKQIASEAINCINALGLESLDVFFVSSYLHGKVTVSSSEEIEYVRGGGTDFRSFFNEENDFTTGNYNGCIFITDGYVYHENKWQRPNCPLLWVLTTRNGMFSTLVPFGECIEYNH